MGDGHTALQQDRIGHFEDGHIELDLVRLVHGKHLSEVTAHVRATTFSVSGGLEVGDVLARIGFQKSGCAFLQGECWWAGVSSDAQAELFGRTISEACDRLAETDWSLRDLLLELPRADGKSRFNRQFVGDVGDGHTGVEVKRIHTETEDATFRYRFTYMKRGTGQAGWITHLSPKVVPDAAYLEVLRLLGFHAFAECPEVAFEPCHWRSVPNPYAGRRNGAFLDRHASAETAHRGFERLQGQLAELCGTIVAAHQRLQSLGFPYLKGTAAKPRVQRPSREVFVPTGSPYDAYAAIRALLTDAEQRVWIVDPYVDGTLAELLAVVPQQAGIRVLTRSFQQDGRLALGKLTEQRGTMEVRTSHAIHDRFIVVDKEIYTLGASVKDAGRKATMLHRVEVSTEIQKAREELEAAWAASDQA